MNNKNFNNLNYNAHNLIDNLNKLGHEILSSTIENSVPIINTLASTNLQTTDFDLFNYQIKNNNENILIVCELPGVDKKNCKVNYINKILIVSGNTDYNNFSLNDQNKEKKWNFIKNKKYYREINVGLIDKNNIKVKHLNGCLYIEIDKINLEKESDIEIN